VHDGWWRDAVFYEVYVRSFADSNGDGLGDLAGVAARLDHLERLGVDAIWITPFYPSPMADHGYDVADHRDVDPRFGTLQDFDRLLEDAHRRGIRVLIDIVPNHTSSAHPWFANALSSPLHPDREKYIFRDPGVEGGPPNPWQSTFGGSAWTLDPGSGQYYLHLFAAEQPDLNWHHPEVRADFEATLRFWLDRGVDGFRVDVAHGLFKDLSGPNAASDSTEGSLREDSVPMWDREEVHQIYRDWRQILDSYPGDRVMVGEVWLARPERVARYVRADEMHLAFNFHLLTSAWSASGFRDAIDRSMAELARVDAVATWVLSNHDVVRHPTRYGGGARGQRRAGAALLFLLALPGPAFLYQGEELGLEEVDLPDEVREDPLFHRTHGIHRGRDGCRVPIPWSSEPPAFGFTTGRPWLPIPEDWGGLSVAAQGADAGSMLHLYRAALAARREHLASSAPGMRWVEASGGCLAFARETGNGRLVCACNFGPKPVKVEMAGGLVLLSDPKVSRSGDHVILPPDTAAWVATSERADSIPAG
jgi:alpha-glucosidase